MDEIEIPMAKPVFEDEEKTGVMNVVNSGWLGQGKVTERFENLLSDKSIDFILGNFKILSGITSNLFVLKSISSRLSGN